MYRIAVLVASNAPKDFGDRVPYGLPSWIKENGKVGKKDRRKEVTDGAKSSGGEKQGTGRKGM